MQVFDGLILGLHGLSPVDLIETVGGPAHCFRGAADLLDGFARLRHARQSVNRAARAPGEIALPAGQLGQVSIEVLSAGLLRGSANLLLLIENPQHEVFQVAELLG